MLKVGLTGGIGSGKSTVAELLQELGAFVIDSDQLARLVIQRGNPGFDEVISKFGDSILVNGEIDRAKLAAVVFNDADKRKELEEIIHPLVRQAAEQIMGELPKNTVVINEIPLLFETAGANRFDFVISVSVNGENRLARLRARGMKDYETNQRISAQASDEQRASISDVVLDNNGTLDDLRMQVEKLWLEQLLPLAAKK